MHNCLFDGLFGAILARDGDIAFEIDHAAHVRVRPILFDRNPNDRSIRANKLFAGLKHDLLAKEQNAFAIFFPRDEFRAGNSMESWPPSMLQRSGSAARDPAVTQSADTRLRKWKTRPRATKASPRQSPDATAADAVACGFRPTYFPLRAARYKKEALTCQGGLVLSTCAFLKYRDRPDCVSSVSLDGVRSARKVPSPA